jgi:6-phosphogluconolactonase
MSDLQIKTFDDRGALDEHLAQDVWQSLNDAIVARGRASLVVSGGSTPKGFFAALTRKKLDWDKLTVTLADDRWVPPAHADSNERLVRENLLVGSAAAARFIPLVTEDPHPGVAVSTISRSLADLGTADVMILGMGDDGHFASLFPGSDSLESGLAMDSRQSFIAVDPPVAPHARMSMTLPRIVDTRRLILHIVGEGKRALLHEAARLGDASILPIVAVIEARSPQAEVYWAP